jgi:hypothetical protein
MSRDGVRRFRGEPRLLRMLSEEGGIWFLGVLPAFATTWLTRYLPQPWTGTRTQRQQNELVRLEYLRLSEGRVRWPRSSQRRLVEYADSLRRLPRRALASELDLHGRDLDGKVRRCARRRKDGPRLMREGRRRLLEMTLEMTHLAVLKKSLF